MDGRPFTIYKFRTMVPDAATSGAGLWFDHDDPRVTPVGRFLRSASIDELPQIWNVLRGDMSLVGPRPKPPEIINRYLSRYGETLGVRPGLTCFSAVEGRNTLRRSQMIAADLRYLRESRWSPTCAYWPAPCRSYCFAAAFTPRTRARSSWRTSRPIPCRRERGLARPRRLPGGMGKAGRRRPVWAAGVPGRGRLDRPRPTGRVRPGDVLYPFLVRPLEGGRCDITSAYGYGGPYGRGEWRQAFAAACREHGVVSEFVRFHPLLGNHDRPAATCAPGSCTT